MSEVERVARRQLLDSGEREKRRKQNGTQSTQMSPREKTIVCRLVMCLRLSVLPGVNLSTLVCESKEEGKMIAERW